MYKKFTQTDLEEAYTELMDHTGTISKELEMEIRNRGGMELFLSGMHARKKLKKERFRIKSEIYALTTIDTNYDFVRKLVNSDSLNEEEINELVHQYHTERQNEIKDKEINSNIIVLTIVGILIAIIAGTGVLYITVILFDSLYYWFLIPVYIVNYLTIKLITKKSRNNIIIFVGSIVAAIGSFVFTLYISGVI